jgi:hypothetical protein
VSLESKLGVKYQGWKKENKFRNILLLCALICKSLTIWFLSVYRVFEVGLEVYTIVGMAIGLHLLTVISDLEANTQG